MGKMTFVVEYEDGKEPSVNGAMEILEGRLTAAAFYDYRDDGLTEDEVIVLTESIDNDNFAVQCCNYMVDGDKLLGKLRVLAIK